MPTTPSPSQTASPPLNSTAPSSSDLSSKAIQTRRVEREQFLEANIRKTGNQRYPVADIVHGALRGCIARVKSTVCPARRSFASTAAMWSAMFAFCLGGDGLMVELASQHLRGVKRKPS